MTQNFGFGLQAIGKTSANNREQGSLTEGS